MIEANNVAINGDATLLFYRGQDLVAAVAEGEWARVIVEDPE